MEATLRRIPHLDASLLPSTRESYPCDSNFHHSDGTDEDGYEKEQEDDTRADEKIGILLGRQIAARQEIQRGCAGEEWG